MVVVDRKYKGAAAQATLQTTMTATTPGAGGTITVSDDSGYPASGKFSITIDRGEANQEHLLINSRSGTTFTIGQRAYDDSVASAHTSGVALVEHWFAARDAQLFVDHVDDVESDPHSTKLLNNARHDLEARHTFGAALGTPVTPTALTPDIAGAAGTGNNPSREDHVHNVPAAAPGNISPDDAAAEGAAASFARSDHTHGITAAVAGTIAPDDSAAEGVATSFARSDHRHAITAAIASSIADTSSNSEGAASSFARSDHGHAFVLGNMIDWARVSRAATQSFTSGVEAAISWDTEDADNGALFSGGAPTRLTMSRNGIALLVANADWDASTTERRRINIRLNGSTIVAQVRWDGVSTDNTPQSVSSGWIQVSAGDFFEVIARQDSGGALNLGGAPTNFSVLLIPT